MIVQTALSELVSENAIAFVRREGFGRQVVPPFEVFRSEPDGTVLWRGTSSSMEEAKKRIRELAAETPGEFIVMSRRTGHKLLVRCDGVDGELQSEDSVF